MLGRGQNCQESGDCPARLSSSSMQRSLQSGRRTRQKPRLSPWRPAAAGPAEFNCQPQSTLGIMGAEAAVEARQRTTQFASVSNNLPKVSKSVAWQAFYI